MPKPNVQKARKVQKHIAIRSKPPRPRPSARPSSAVPKDKSKRPAEGAGRVILNEDGHEVPLPGPDGSLLFGNRVRSGSGGGSSWEFQVVNYLMTEEWVSVQISMAYERWSFPEPESHRLAPVLRGQLTGGKDPGRAL